jgi:hypothetical protein
VAGPAGVGLSRSRVIFQTLGKSGSVFPQFLSCASNRWISAMVIDIERTHTVGFLLSFFIIILLLIILCSNWEQGEDSQVP